MNEGIKEEEKYLSDVIFYNSIRTSLQRLRVSDMEGVVGVVNILVGHGMAPASSASVFSLCWPMIAEHQ